MAARALESVQALLPIQAQQLVNNYTGFFEPQTGQELTGPGIFASLFRQNEAGGIMGFAVSLPDFIDIFSAPGITHWHVQFGFNQEGDHFISALPSGFQLLIHGRGEGPTAVITETVALRNIYSETLPMPDMTAIHEGVVTSDGIQSERLKPIPYGVAITWQQAWKNLMVEQDVPPEVLTIALSDGSNPVLQGYAFARPTVEQIARIASNAQITQIRFSLINMASVAKLGQHQAGQRTGYLGFMIAAASDEFIISAGFDFSSPCPPTCPTSGA